MVRREACDAAPPASVELCSGEHGLYHNARDNAMWQKDGTAVGIEYQCVVNSIQQMEPPSANRIVQ